MAQAAKGVQACDACIDGIHGKCQLDTMIELVGGNRVEMKCLCGWEWGHEPRCISCNVNHTSRAGGVCAICAVPSSG